MDVDALPAAVSLAGDLQIIGAPKAPDRAGHAVACDGVGPGGEDRAHPASVSGEVAMADGVDTAVNLVNPT